MKKLFFLLFSSLYCLSAIAQDTGAISGLLTDSGGEQLIGITVELVGHDRFTSTDENGHFLFQGVPVGAHQIAISSIQFTSRKQPVEVTEGETTVLRLQLDFKINELQEVTVVAAYLRNYNGTQQTNAKLPARLIDVPQSIKTLNRDLIDDRQALFFSDIAKYSSGVNVGTSANEIIMRGFNNSGGGAAGSAQFINGMRNYFTGYEHELNLTNVERIEFMKGPSSMLYGTLMPGGAINVVTKKPEFEHRVGAGLSIGTWGRYRFDTDITGPIGKQQKAAFRLNLGFQNSPDYRDFIFNKNFSGSLALTFRPDDRTKIDVEGSYLNVYRSTWYDWGVPAFNDDLFAVPISFTSHEPTDFFRWNNLIVMATVEHRVNNELSLHFNANGSSNRNAGEAHSPSFFAPFPAEDSLISRVFRDITNQNDALFAGAFLKWKKELGKTKHTFTFGMDAMRGRLTSNVIQASSFQGVPGINPLLPRYRQAVPSTFDITSDAGFFGNTQAEFWGIYLMDFIQLSPKMNLLLSGRFDYYNQFNVSYSNFTTRSNNINRPFIPGVGLSYELADDFMVYGNWSRGFTPQTNQNPDRGGPFDPLYSQQWEGGLKKEFLGGRWSVTTAYYDIKRFNVLVPADPDNAFGLQVSEGEQSSQGFELDISGQVTPFWNVIGALSYNDTRVTKTTRDFEQGLRLNNAPYWLGSLWNRFNIKTGVLNGLGFGLGINHASGAQTAGDISFPTRRPFNLPGYTIVDAAVFYRKGNMQLSCNLENLFNERYYRGGTNIWYLIPGLPRNALLRLKVSY